MLKSSTLFLCAFGVAASVTAGDHAAALITTGELRTHVATLAADSFEGREAGRRGGHAASAYLLSDLKRLDVRPAGDGGRFVQEFGPGYRNILALIPGSDERLKDEVVVVGAHYDHVGYGSKGNSFGPLGQIHNGADDNASGTAALLELIQAFAAAERKPKRTLLFAFWDAEEKGLLGSDHWLTHPTVPRRSIRFALNFDMLGRMRNRTVEVYGVRTATGLRQLLAAQNAETGLTLNFDWTQRDDSDHWSFYKRHIPYLMLHTGLHDEYHRPTDDAHLIDPVGLRDVAELCRKTIIAVADAPSLTFRPECTHETNETNYRLSAPLPQPPSRLGVRWDAALAKRSEFVLTFVAANSPAAAAGMQIGDRIASVNGEVPADTIALRKQVLAIERDATFTVLRDERRLELRVRLAGSPVRIGLTWRTDEAESGTMIVRGIVAGSPADEAGLQPGDRIVAVNEKPFADAAEFRTAFRDSGNEPGLLVERNGRLWTAAMRLGIDARGLAADHRD